MSSNKEEQKRTAIVIDDDPHIVEVFSDLLQILQIKVIGKGFDGNKAIELYEELRPGLVVIDVYMPKCNGYQALEKIKEINPNVKSVVITARSLSDVKSSFEKLNPSAVVHKPTSADKILEVISNVMQLSDYSKHEI